MKSLVILMLMVGTAWAQSEDDHVKAANDYFAVGNFEGALAEYRAAYAINPKADYLYAMATIEDQRGGCKAAIDLYEQFLATSPPEEDVEAVKAAIETCKGKLGEEEQPPPVAHKMPPKPKPPPPPPKPRTRRVQRGFFSDVLGDALVGAGVAGLGAGIVFDVLARDDASKAAEPGTRDDYDRLWARAQDRQQIAEIAAGVGGALVIGGVVRWLTVDRWTVVPEASGGAVTVMAASRW